MKPVTFACQHCRPQYRWKWFALLSKKEPQLLMWLETRYVPEPVWTWWQRVIFSPCDVVHTQLLCLPNRRYCKESDSKLSARFTQLKASLHLQWFWVLNSNYCPEWRICNLSYPSICSWACGTPSPAMCEELKFCTLFEGHIEGLVESMWQQQYRARWRLQSTVSVSVRTGWYSEAYSSIPNVVN